MGPGGRRQIVGEAQGVLHIAMQRLFRSVRDLVLEVAGLMIPAELA
jgi:hypothetical protein